MTTDGGHGIPRGVDQIAVVVAAVRSLARGKNVLNPSEPFDAKEQEQIALAALTELRKRETR